MDATAIAVCISALISVIVIIVKVVRDRKKNKVKTIAPQIDWNSIRQNFDELKKRVRIVVIDDEDSFPIKLFQSEGYAVDKWDKVTQGTYGKLESGFYDIIVLDIKGVATELSADDGLGVLESLKKRNPAQIIIAFSQHSYDLSVVRFWQLADEHISKPSDFLKIKEIIDNLINTKYNPSRYVNAFKHLLSENRIAQDDQEKIEGEISSSLQNNQQPNWVKILEIIKNNPDLVKQLTTIGQSLYKFFS